MVFGDFKDMTKRTDSNEVLIFLKIQNKQKNYTSQLLGNLKNEWHIYLTKTIFRVLILWIHHWSVNLIKDFAFYYLLLIFIVNINGLFL